MKILMLIKLSKIPILGKIFKLTLLFLGLDVPKEVIIGKGVLFEHYGMGTVIHPKTIIGDHVRIYHNVTIGRADVHIKNPNMQGIEIKENAIICSGAKILCKSGLLTIGKNTIIGANAVLLSSTGDNEIWVGIPAKKIGNIQ